MVLWYRVVAYWARGTVVSVDNKKNGPEVNVKLYYNGRVVTIWLKSADHKIRPCK